MNKLRYVLLALFVSLVLVACGGSGATEPPVAITESAAATTEAPLAATEAPAEASESVVAGQEAAGEAGESMAEEGEAMAEEAAGEGDEALHEEEMMGEDEGMMAEEEAMEEEAMAGEGERPAWQHLPLTNASSGETFTLADFAGKTVFVEPMATWCTNCRRQLGNVRQAREQLEGEDVVFVALSVETNIGDGDLAQYAQEAGFDWVFAVMTPEMLQQLVDAFGRAIGNPPSTPHFVIRPDGTTTELVTGIDPPEQLIAQLQGAQ